MQYMRYMYACQQKWDVHYQQHSMRTFVHKIEENPTSPTGALFRTHPIPCAFLVIRALALPSAELPGCRPQIPRPRRRHLVHEFSGFKFVLQKR